MIEFQSGNLLKSPAQALVNTVNCVGVMGKGIALQFANAFPYNTRVYKEKCKAGEMAPGRVLMVDLGDTENPRWIINFPTKDHWRGNSRLEWIESGLENLVAEVRAHGIRSIAIPPLGCGAGGLDWNVVRPLIEAAFEELPEVEVLLFTPAGAPAPETMKAAQTPPKMGLASALYVRLIESYSILENAFSELELQKLAYFLQVAGQPLQLKFEKGRYGPYAPNLRHVLKRWENHWMVGYGDGTRGARATMTLNENLGERASEFLNKQDDSDFELHLSAVNALIEGFETPLGLELLATVHYVYHQENVRTVDAATARIHAWNDYKKAMFTPRLIELAWDQLDASGWLGN